MERIKKNIFPIGGMSCAACAARVEKTLRSYKGVKEAAVNFATSGATVEYYEDICSPEDLQNAVRAAGYELILNETADEIENQQEKKYIKLKTETILALVLSLPVVIIGMFFMNMPFGNIIMLIFSTPVVFWCGRRFFIGAWRQLKHRTSNMDTLVALSTGIAWVFSVANMLFPEYWISMGIHPHVYFEASAVIIAFILLGRTLESKAKGNTSSAIKKLMGLQPKNVTIINPDGSQSVVPIMNIAEGDTIMIHPGERVAVDGMVIDGESFVDESMLSGEPIPVEKIIGEKVFAGTINGNGSFKYRAVKVGSDTLLSKIIRMVQDAQGSKAPVQQLVDKIAAIFVPTIISIAILTFIIWFIFGSDDSFSHGMLAAVTVLIIACPCALGLATPTAIMVGIGKGAELGILIKDAESLEIAPKINAIVLDKTGTLTEGRPEVTQVVTLKPVSDNNVKKLESIILSLEQKSEHPLAKAVTEYFSSSDFVEVKSFESITGKGVKGEYDGITFYVGNQRLIKENGIKISDKALRSADQLTKKGCSLVWIADSEEVLEIMGISDPIKKTSASAIRRLEQMGIDTYMLTGDNRATAEIVAGEVGIKHCVAEVLPQDKCNFVKKLQKEGKKVAMVGDGINDSAALAAANLSIAMGTGSDVAIEVAKMTIVSADLAKIPVAFHLSKLTVRTIRQNLFWAFIYNLIGVPIAAGALYPICGFLLNPMIAGAAMAFSSVSVVTNSLLLKRKKFHMTSENSCETNNYDEALNLSAQKIIDELSNEHNPYDIVEEKLKFDKNKEIMTQKFKVEGMACSHCSGRVETTIKNLPGVTGVTVDLSGGMANVEGDVAASVVEEAVSNAGYPCKKM
ncbi:MAG: heavy metal translocating P-type ATPase [Bacteroides sp.]|nr:heavy metal translocating P-type ATPase [Bacteroides sp.]